MHMNFRIRTLTRKGETIYVQEFDNGRKRRLTKASAQEILRNSNGAYDCARATIDRMIEGGEL